MTKRLRSNPIVPLYHPTSILLVDDNEDFMRSMKLALGTGFDCRTFKRASDAIDFIRSEPVLLRQALTDFVHDKEEAMEHIADPKERRLHIEVSRLPRVFSDHSRFIRTSVVVAETAMPGMSGLDMLEILRDTPMRKLLLSGAVDEQVASYARSAGIIDGYFPKHHPTLHDTLTEHLTTLQFEFFRQVTLPYEPALARSEARFLCDPSFPAIFDQFVIRHHIIEYCILTQPPGILGIDEHGNSVILLVADQDFRRASFEIAQAEGAPPDLLKCLMDGASLAAFPTRTCFFSQELSSLWEYYIWPSESFGDGAWSCAVVTDRTVVGRVCGKIAPYADHRRRRIN